MPSTPVVDLRREGKRTRTRAQRLIEQIGATLQALEAGTASIGDLKIVARALQEMRAGFELFAPYRDTRKVAPSARRGHKRTTPSFAPPRPSRGRSPTPASW